MRGVFVLNGFVCQETTLLKQICCQLKCKQILSVFLSNRHKFFRVR